MIKIKNMNKKRSFNPKKLSFLFAAVAFITGFLLIDRGSISGNVVGSNSPIGTISIIGLLLIASAIVLAAKGIRK